MSSHASLLDDWSDCSVAALTLGSSATPRGRNGDGAAGQARHIDGRAAVRCRAVAELAVEVVAPALHTPARRERACVISSSRDGGDAAGQRVSACQAGAPGPGLLLPAAGPPQRSPRLPPKELACASFWVASRTGPMPLPPAGCRQTTPAVIVVKRGPPRAFGTVPLTFLRGR